MWQQDVLLTSQTTLLPPLSEASPTDNCHMLQKPKNKINIYSRHALYKSGGQNAGLKCDSHRYETGRITPDKAKNLYI
jgi:hypothetical protein